VVTLQQVRTDPSTVDDYLALLDAIPDSTAVLDRTGTVVAVNRAWRMFTLDNGGSPESTGPGVSYLEVCERSARAGCSDAAEVVAGLRAVLAGEQVDSELQYPCPSPAVGRWYALRITAVAGDPPGLLVTHVNISRQKQAERELAQRAAQDSLTGLANRAGFTDQLTQALTSRTGRPPTADTGVVYLDLDGFKPVNDTYGHPAGDEVLQTVAARLRRTTRPQDTVARLGGDEFAVVADRITAEGLHGLVERLTSALAEPHRIHGREVSVRASVGSYLAVPGDSVAECVRRADLAMYAVKRSRATRR
jgi:diguanylate cyclase (GGDEF)-like protein